MTAVEWLDRWFRDNPEATHQEGNKALQQAKAMEKQQIIDAYHTNPQEAKWKNIGINYYNETYGSKGSDEHIVDTNEMIDHIGDANEMVEDTFKVWECCGMEECECGLTPDEQIIKDLHNERKAHAIDFAKWIAKEWMSMWVVDRWLWENVSVDTNEQSNWKGYFTEEQLYELYLEQTK